MRYVLGPSFDAKTLFTPGTTPTPTPVPANPDPDVTLTSVDDSGVNLTFPGFDPAKHNTPTEIRCYLVPSGTALPATADEWIASSHPVSTAGAAIAPPDPSVKVPLPAVPFGDYLGQVLIGFPA
jgi:hypothetical protein